MRFLFKKGASPNKTSKNNLIPPIALAGHHGYYKVLKVFKDEALKNVKVNFAAKDGIKKENVLHKIVKGESRTSVKADLRDYDKCLDLLLEDSAAFRHFILPAVNGVDQMGNTPL